MLSVWEKMNYIRLQHHHYRSAGCVRKHLRTVARFIWKLLRSLPQCLPKLWVPIHFKSVQQHLLPPYPAEIQADNCEREEWGRKWGSKAGFGTTAHLSSKLLRLSFPWSLSLLLWRQVRFSRLIFFSHKSNQVGVGNGTTQGLRRAPYPVDLVN